jgi:hypothetical protein
MNPIKNTLSQLVRRRLWPVAVLLVAALVAVPMTLAKSPAAAPAPPANATASTAGDQGATQPIVQLSDAPAGDARRRRVLGVAKDPFEPAPLPKVKKAKKKKHSTAKKAAATPTATPTATPAANGGAGAGGGATATPTATPVPTVHAPKGSVRVRFGVSTGDAPDPQLVAHLDPLPSADTPVLVLEGLKDNGRTAVFSIPGTVTAQGDGSCHPAVTACQTLELKAGQTEFITVKGVVADDGTTGKDAQFELDLLNIYTKSTQIPQDSVVSKTGDSGGA